MNIHKCSEAARWKAEVLQMMWDGAKDHAAGAGHRRDWRGGGRRRNATPPALPNLPAPIPGAKHPPKPTEHEGLGWLCRYPPRGTPPVPGAAPLGGATPKGTPPASPQKPTPPDASPGLGCWGQPPRPPLPAGQARTQRWGCSGKERAGFQARPGTQPAPGQDAELLRPPRPPAPESRGVLDTSQRSPPIPSTSGTCRGGGISPDLLGEGQWCSPTLCGDVTQHPRAPVTLPCCPQPRDTEGTR